MERDELSWEQWAERLQWYSATSSSFFSPDLFVVGGGVSKHADKFLHLLDLKTPIVPAVHRNNAGIIGAGRARTERICRGGSSGGRVGRMGRPVRRVLSGGRSPLDGLILSATRCRAAPAAYPGTRRAASSSPVWPCSGRGLPWRVVSPRPR